MASQDPEPSAAIDLFLSDARWRLRRHLPSAQLDAVIAEAKDHLAERASALIDGGASPRQAAAAAVTAFGSAREWAGKIADAAYGDRQTAMACRIAIFAGIAGLIGAIPSTTAYSSWYWPAVTISAGLLLAVSSFRARQSLPRKLSILVPAFIAVSFFVEGFTQIVIPGFDPMPRHETKWLIPMYEEQIAEHQPDVNLLHLGQRTYPRSGPGGPVPTTLRTANGAYIVPFPNDQMPANVGVVELKLGTFKRPVLASSVAVRSPADMQRLNDETPFYTMQTRALAAQAWQRNAGAWLLNYQGQDWDLQADINRLRAADNETRKFDWNAGMRSAETVGCISIGFILLSYLFACLGRAAWRKSRWTSQSQAEINHG